LRPSTKRQNKCLSTLLGCGADSAGPGPQITPEPTSCNGFKDLLHNDGEEVTVCKYTFGDPPKDDAIGCDSVTIDPKLSTMDQCTLSCFDSRIHIELTKVHSTGEDMYGATLIPSQVATTCVKQKRPDPCAGIIPFFHTEKDAPTQCQAYQTGGSAIVVDRVNPFCRRRYALTVTV
jgi:hypothetical protein